MFEEETPAYIATHGREKLQNPFKGPMKIDTIDPAKKVVSIQKQGKVHMSNLKRPLRKRYSFNRTRNKD